MAANKIDALDDPARLAQLQAKAAELKLPVFPISAVSGQGVPSLLEAMWRGMTRTDDDAGFEE